MRFGTIEGSPQEIKDLIENHGLRMADYVRPLEPQLERRWLVIPTILVVIALILTVALGGIVPAKGVLLFLLAGFGGGTWLAVSLQIRFRNAAATFAVAVGLLLMLLLAAGLISPTETPELIRRLRQPGP